MSNGNPNAVILNKAWALLWQPTSSYYLPTILKNGATFGGTTIPPMSQLPLNDIKSLPLYSSNFWGNVSISLTGLVLSGLPSIQNQSFTPSSNAASVTATVAFGSLTFGGNYEVVGSGIAGCAMSMGWAKAYSGATAGDDPPPANMDLARQYRDQLVNQPGLNGLSLVSTYYDQNDTINTILSQNNAFTRAWPLAHPSGGPNLTTAFYMGVTNAAGENPGSPLYPVGYVDYDVHAYYMQTVLLATALDYADGSKDAENPYVALADAIKGFKGYTLTKKDDPMTVNAVMDTVQNTPPMSAAALAAVPETEAARIGREMAERDYPRWRNEAMAAEAARTFQGTTYTSSGSFSFGFSMPTVTFTGTVMVSGIPPHETMTITLTSLTASIPNVDIQLLNGTDANFTRDAQAQINNAEWFQKNIGLKVNTELGSPTVLSYVSNLFNQALNNILGS